MDEENKICGTCLLCLSTYLGCEYSLTDSAVDYTQAACIDYINEEEGQK